MLDEAAAAVAAGVTTDEIDRVVHEATVDRYLFWIFCWGLIIQSHNIEIPDIHEMCLVRDCYPSPLNYYQFPKSCCTSVNEVDISSSLEDGEDID